MHEITDTSDENHPEGMTRMTTDRREFLKQLAAVAVAAPLVLSLARAQGGHMGQNMPGMPGAQGMPGMGQGQPPTDTATSIGPDVLQPIDIPWDGGTCAFCGMTIATPAQGAVPAGFRERTYAQIRLAPGNELDDQPTLHYESLACMFNHAYIKNIVDGHGATFYVADLPTPPQTAGDLLLARKAVYMWGERLSVSMRAHLGAFSDLGTLEMYAVHHDVGRYHYHSAQELIDLTPIPEAGLLGLLVRHSE